MLIQLNKAHWSSGQDVALSRRKQGFDSPMGHQKTVIHLVWLFFMGNRTREGFAVKKTVWYTVFRQKSRALQARPASMQGEAAADGDSPMGHQNPRHLVFGIFSFYCLGFFAWEVSPCDDNLLRTALQIVCYPS